MARRIAARLADLHGASPHTFPVPSPLEDCASKSVGFLARAEKARGLGLAPPLWRVATGRERSRRLRKAVLEVSHLRKVDNL